MNNKPTRVVLGFSGGVDSSVSALLLKQQGYEVIGVFMQNWDSFVNNELNHQALSEDKCDSQVEYDQALKVAQQIGIELHKVDFIKEYWDYVFSNFIKQYQSGLTPNPDILCNKYIKFGFFLDYCKQQFNYDYLATGHYAKVIHNEDVHYLLIPKDYSKDQTYFLCELTQNQLKDCLFPLADLLKTQVRQIAREHHLINWDKKDSTGICFIGKRNFRSFLSNYINPKKGDIIDIETNQIIGSHNGAFFYTIGQNEGLNLGGFHERYYVVKKDVVNNLLYVVNQYQKDKYLISYECIVDNFNFIVYPKQDSHLKVRFRHLQELIDCSLETINNQQIKIIYKSGSIAVACGQYAVVYDNDICIGGGQITKVGL